MSSNNLHLLRDVWLNGFVPYGAQFTSHLFWCPRGSLEIGGNHGPVTFIYDICDCRNSIGCRVGLVVLPESLGSTRGFTGETQVPTTQCRGRCRSMRSHAPHRQQDNSDADDCNERNSFVPHSLPPSTISQDQRWVRSEKCSSRVRVSNSAFLGYHTTHLFGHCDTYHLPFIIGHFSL